MSYPHCDDPSKMLTAACKRCRRHIDRALMREVANEGLVCKDEPACRRAAAARPAKHITAAARDAVREAREERRREEGR